MSNLSKEQIYSKVSFSPDAKLPLLDKIVYCAGSGMGTTISWTVFGYYLMFFYTDVMGISAAVAGMIILCSRIFDAFTDVIMGWAVDRFNLPWGKYRSWVIISLVPITVLLIGVFTVLPGLSYTGRVVWASLTYGTFGSIGATLAYIPMNSMLMNMTKNVEERASVAGIKQVFTNACNIIVSSIFLPMVNLLGGGKMEIGFFLSSVVIALFALILLLGVISVSKKYELNADGSHREHLYSTEHDPVLKQVKGVFQNRPAVLLVIGIALQYILQAVRNGMVVYVFNYYLNMADFLPIAMFANTVCMVIGAMLLKPVIHVIKDSNRAFILSMGLNIAFTILFWIICKGMGPSGAAISMQYGLLFFIFAITGLLSGLHYSYMSVLLPNVIEYGAWKTGKYQPGMIYALSAVCLTVGGAIGGQFMGVLLDAAGYVANTVQTANVQSRLLFIAFVVPSILAAVQLVIQLFFGLTDKQCNEYAKENQARVKAAASGNAKQSADI